MFTAYVLIKVPADLFESILQSNKSHKTDNSKYSTASEQ